MNLETNGLSPRKDLTLDTLTTACHCHNSPHVITTEWLVSNAPPYPDPKREKILTWLVGC